MIGISHAGGLLGAVGKLASWLVASGVFLVLHTLFMDRESLQDPWIPVHIVVLGIIGALLYSALSAKARMVEILALAALSFGLTWLSGFEVSKGAVFVPGWAILGAWGAWVVIRGGDR